MKGNELDTEKAAKLLLDDFRNGRLGRITFVVEEFRDGKAIVAETVKNYPNVANRAKLMFALWPQGMKVKHEIPADHIVVSVGYLPDDRLYEQIKGDHVYLIGDAKRPTNVMDAIWAAYEIAKDI